MRGKEISEGSKVMKGKGWECIVSMMHSRYALRKTLTPQPYSPTSFLSWFYMVWTFTVSHWLRILAMVSQSLISKVLSFWGTLPHLLALQRGLLLGLITPMIRDWSEFPKQILLKCNYGTTLFIFYFSRQNIKLRKSFWEKPTRPHSFQKFLQNPFCRGKMTRDQIKWSFSLICYTRIADSTLSERSWHSFPNGDKPS